MSFSKVGSSQTMNFLEAVTGSQASRSSSSSASLSHFVPANNLPEYDSAIYNNDWEVEVMASGSLPERTISNSPFPVRIASPTNEEVEEMEPRGPLEAIQVVIDTLDGIEIYDQNSNELGGLSESDWDFVEGITEEVIDRLKNEELLNLTFKEAALVSGKGKNRYTDIKPFDFSIAKAFSQLENREVYVNANWIEMNGQRFVATQAPLPQTRADFVSLVGQSGAKVIATMAMVVEANKVKGFAYWPKEEKVIASKGNQSIVVRDVAVFDRNGGMKTVKQVHYQNWPDQGTPDMDLYTQFLSLVEQYAEDQPIVTHCSAGVGRTGIVIAGLTLKQEIREAKEAGIEPEDIRVNVPKTILKLRAQRNESMCKRRLNFNLLRITRNARSSATRVICSVDF